MVGGDHRAACHYAEEALKSDVGVAQVVVGAAAPELNATAAAMAVREASDRDDAGRTSGGEALARDAEREPTPTGEE